MTALALRGKFLALLALVLPASIALAERAAVPAIVPADTLALVRVANMPELSKRLSTTALGKATQDPEIAPLVSKFYGSLADWWKDIEERVGLPLDQLLAIPQGETAFAVIPQGERAPAIVVFIDVKDQLAQAQRLIDKGEAAIADQGGTKEMEIVGDTRVTIYVGANGRRRLTRFEKDGTLVFATTLDAAKSVLENWQGGDGKRLIDNERFATIMNRCRGAKDDPPQFSWFWDPITTVKTLGRNNVGAQTVITLFPVIGLDGIQGAGGSMTFDTGEFDVIGHFHLLMKSPRSGVLDLITLGSGETTPEPWVPSDAANYMTIHWDLNRMYRNGAKIYNSLTDEGAFEAEVKQRVSRALDIDFETELLPALAGRVSLYSWMQKPYRFNSSSSAIGLRLSDAKGFQPTLEKILSKIPEGTEKASFGGVNYYRVKQRERNPDAPPNELIRRPSPCIGIVGDYVLVCDSEDNFRHALEAQIDKEKQLASQLDFKLIAGKIRRQNGGERPGMISFDRPEEGLRAVYETARSSAAKDQLDKMANDNRFFTILKTAVDDHPLPPFSVLEKYFAPGGSVVTNEESGFHWMMFQLKRGGAADADGN